MNILQSIKMQRRTLGILVDPEKLPMEDFPAFAKAMTSKTPYLFDELQLDQIIFLQGGSTMENIDLNNWTAQFKKHTDLKILIFPGSADQITDHADGLLFLNLISGRNPDYLIEQQVNAAARLKNSKLEIIPTAYLLLDGGTQTAVARVSQTLPMNQNDREKVVNTAFAGQLMGNQLVYLEAGSGAKNPVLVEIVEEVSKAIAIPVIVGGGLKTIEQISNRFLAGASMVVVGTAIEQNLDWKG